MGQLKKIALTPLCALGAVACLSLSATGHAAFPAYRRYSPVMSFNLDEKQVLNSAIRISARENRLEDLKEYLSKPNADIDSRSDDGLTALMYAAKRCLPEILRFLLASGARINLQDKWGRTALMHGARAGCLSIVSILLKEPKTRLHLKDKTGRKALDYARSATLLEVDGPAIQMLRLLERRALPLAPSSLSPRRDK